MPFNNHARYHTSITFKLFYTQDIPGERLFIKALKFDQEMKRGRTTNRNNDRDLCHGSFQGADPAAPGKSAVLFSYFLLLPRPE